MRISDKLSLLVEALKNSPKPPGFPAFEWTQAEGLTKLRAMVAEADREIAKAATDPMIPAEGRRYREGQIRSDLAAKVAAWRTETLDALGEKISHAIPVPPASTASPAYAEQLLRGFDEVDPVMAESFYLSPSLPGEVARVLESAPARIVGGPGVVPKVTLRVSSEAKARRWYADAPVEAQERHDGLRQIADTLAGAAGLVEAACRATRDE